MPALLHVLVQLHHHAVPPGALPTFRCVSATDRSSLDAALAERRLRLRLSADGLISGVVSGDPNELFGLEAGKLVGRGLWEVLDSRSPLTAFGDERPCTAGPQAVTRFIHRCGVSSPRVLPTFRPPTPCAMELLLWIGSFVCVTFFVHGPATNLFYTCVTSHPNERACRA